jgi:hypothetical protein
MSPRSTFTVPLGDVIELVTETRRTQRGNCTTEKQVPFHSNNACEDAKGSLSKKKNTAGTQASDSAAKASSHLSDDYELHPLHNVEDAFDMEGDNIFDFDMEEPPPLSNVCGP